MDVKIAEAGNWQVDAAKAGEAMQWFVDNTTFYGGLSAVGQVSYKTVLPGGSYYAAQVNNPSATAQTFRSALRRLAGHPWPMSLRRAARTRCSTTSRTPRPACRTPSAACTPW